MNKHLYDEITKRWLDGCDSIWIYSDTHFSDVGSFQFRKDFDSLPEDISTLDEYNNFIIKNINSKAGKNSCLIILGDVGDLECVKKLKAKRKILIMGNHDRGASNYKRVIEYLPHRHMDNYDILVPVVYKGIGNIDVQDSLVKHCAVEREDKDIITFDNHLFDEVYEGPLMINDRVILSHEPIYTAVPYLYNIHGHVHKSNYKGDSHHLNCCAEAIDYTPINLLSLFKKGLLKDVDSIHRMTIDFATKRKK